MSKGASLKLNLSKNIAKPNIYAQQMYGKYADFIFDEVSGKKWKGLWKDKVFNNLNGRLHLEIGTGTGLHIAGQSVQNSNDSFIGIELKYKPLIQSIQRAVKLGSRNVRLVRYNACQLDHLFGKNEVDDIYIHFPDPWPKRRQKKHRLVTSSFIKKIAFIQKQNAMVEIKTDCKDYFMENLSLFKNSVFYKPGCCLLDLHKSSISSKQILTTFESLFIKKKLPVYFMQLRRV